MAPTCRTALPFASGAEMLRSEIPFTYIPLQLLSRRYSSGAELFPMRNSLHQHSSPVMFAALFRVEPICSRSEISLRFFVLVLVCFSRVSKGFSIPRFTFYIKIDYIAHFITHNT